MCGIAGLSLKAGRSPDPDLLCRLSDALAHRGPDGQGQFVAGSTALLHRRLSIIDVSGGAQPILAAPPGHAAADKSAIICNGEIYNYRALQKSLEAEGQALATRSDSELPLHLWHRQRIEFPRALEGMFALAIYDAALDCLVLARDPFGIKQLYYAETGAGLAFASEPSALVQAGWITGAVNPDALPGLLNRQYHAGEDCLFQGIKRLAPGELLLIREGEIRERHSFPPDLQPARPAGSLSESDALAALDRLFSTSIQAHLQSEVPYGAFLSGGIDSSSIVTAIARETGRGLKTFTIGFADDSVADERAQAKWLAERLGTDHHEILFSEQDFQARLPELARSADDLVADYAILPSLKLAEAARKEVTVILTGEGGDEMFAGYGRYRPKGWRRLLPGFVPAALRSPPGAKRRGDASRFAELFREPALAAVPEAGSGGTLPRGLSPLQIAQWRDLRGWLSDDLLVKTDRCLMHHSLEGRVPLLDRDLAAFAFALPDGLKVQGRTGKYLLRRWLEQRHDGALDVWGRKRGFTVPVQAWLNRQRPALSRYLCTQPGLAEILHMDRLAALLDRELDKKAAKLLFTLLVFALWHDCHILGTPGQGPDWRE